MHGLLDLFWIRVALLDQTHWQTVRAEHQMNPRAVREMPQYRSNPLNQRLNIKRMIVEIVDGAFYWFPCRQFPLCLIGDPAPFLQAAECRRVRIVRIKRQQDDFVKLLRLAQHIHGLSREWMPVTHRRDSHRVNVRRDRLYQTHSLAFGERPNRRAPPDLTVLAGDGNRPARRNELRNRATEQSKRSERNNVGVQKQIQQKRLD